MDNLIKLDASSLLLEKKSPHNLLSGLYDLGYFWKKNYPHNLLSNLCDVIYFWKKNSPHNLLPSLCDDFPLAKPWAPPLSSSRMMLLLLQVSDVLALLVHAFLRNNQGHDKSFACASWQMFQTVMLLLLVLPRSPVVPKPWWSSCFSFLVVKLF